jgi:FAD-dependent monooxygenase
VAFTESITATNYFRRLHPRIFDDALGVKEAEKRKTIPTEPTEEDLMVEFAEKMKVVGAEDTGGMGEVKFVAGFQVEVE